ncbi:MFS transporter [Roseixanthobacter glucoisosaccharinicivorans]|uniref:MFS transporter n=1 Tax=Roseixanthobacter glucoisosaccharinicivorans TaxID=3119923 RepID=UPI00372C88CA
MDRRLLVLALGMFALGTDSFVMAGVLPEIARAFGVSIGAAGQMTTVYAVTIAVLAPIIAAIAAHVPRKQLLLISLAIFVIANLGTALAPTFEVALATRALAGLGAAMFAPTATGSAASIVAPERRGFALALVATGMTVSTALGAPIGTLIGGLADWHWTMVLVSALAGVSFVGVAIFLSHIPMLPPISLAKRLAPLADARIGLSLATTLLFFSAAFTIYTYFAVAFGRAIAGNASVLAGLLVAWGLAGTVSNLVAGRLSDSLGSRRVLIAMMVLVTANFLLLRWTGASLWTAIPAVVLWGACGWGSTIPQQHRLVHIAPHIAPILLGLYSSFVFLGTTVAGVIGATAIEIVGGENLGYVAAALTFAALIVSELADRKIAAARLETQSVEAAGSTVGGPQRAEA